MNLKKILIAFGTRYGSTEEIANKISEIFNQKGLEPSIMNLKDVNSFDSIDLEEYDGILLGSGIKIGKWTKSVQSFMKYLKEKSYEKNKKLGVFISSGEAGNPDNRSQIREKYIENVLNELDINVDLYDAFGGVIDLSDNSNLGFLTKKMLKAMAKKDPNITYGEVNDGRDWDQITNFAEKFAKLVEE